MHMSDALLSPAVGIAMDAVSAGCLALSVSKIKKDEFSDKKIPIMGVAGALVFAAQMINFTIPGTGSSGHIGGGILLSGLLGGFPAFLSISAVLIIQCLFFADGGLLALGCNIFNMGVIPCLIAYPLLFKPILAKGLGYKRISAASVLSCVASLEVGALFVVLETALSGVTALPIGAFSLLMLPIHLPIGIVEGLVTAGVLSFIYSMRPEILESAFGGKDMLAKVSVKKAVLTLAAIALVTGGVFSVMASSMPDGLEWSVDRVTGGQELEAAGALHGGASKLQEKTAILPDYSFSGKEGSNAGTITSGVIGSAITFTIAALAAGLISWRKRSQKEGTKA